MHGHVTGDIRLVVVSAPLIGASRLPGHRGRQAKAAQVCEYRLCRWAPSLASGVVTVEASARQSPGANTPRTPPAMSAASPLPERGFTAEKFQVSL